MTDEYVISRLRSAETGDAEPTQADVTAAVTRGRRMRRRRKGLAVAGAASALSFAVVAGLVLMPKNDVTVLQQAPPAGDGADPQPATGAEAEPDPKPATETERVDPLVVLREVMGPEDWRLILDADGERKLVPAADSSVTDGLPAGYRPSVEIEVAPATESVATCPSTSGKFRSCELREIPDGRKVRISRHEFTDAQPTGSGSTFVDDVRDGTRITIWLDVTGPRDDTSTAHWQQAERWLMTLDAKLIAGATDPRVQLDPEVRAKSDARTAYLDASDANARLFRDILGTDWGLVTLPFGGMRTSYSTHLQKKTPTYEALPPGSNVWATLDGSPIAVSDSEPCGPNTDRNIAFVTCRPRTLSDGRSVLIGSASGMTTDGHSAAEGLRVVYVRPDGIVAIAQLVVVEQPDAVTNESRQKSRAWLEGFEDKLIAAATDERVQRVPLVE